MYFQLEGDGIYQYNSTGITYLFGESEFQDTEVIELFPLSDGLRVLTSSKGFYSYRNKVLRPWAVLKSILKPSCDSDFNQPMKLCDWNGTKYILFLKMEREMNFEKGFKQYRSTIYEDKDFNLFKFLQWINCTYKFSKSITIQKAN